MIKLAQKGFTLIELAIVIAILGILAAVALNNLGNTQAAAECSMIKDMAAQLSSGYATFTAAEGNTPPGFTNYVMVADPATNNGFPAPLGTGATRTNYSINLWKFGTNAQKSTPQRCTVAAATITCNNVFMSYPNNVVYNFYNGAVTIATPLTSPTNGVPECR